MSKFLIINAEGPETRVASLEHDELVEVYIERHRERGIVGNIYKGRVSRVLPGMQAAFVDIGTDKAAFLYVAEVRGGPEDVRSIFGEEEDEFRERASEHTTNQTGPRIEDLLKPGQDILLQVAKAPMGTKGPRATSYVSLPGRNLVFLPTIDHVGISRRISNEKERRRLRTLVDALRPPGTGLIVRTVAESVSDAELRADVEFLVRLWRSITKKAESAKAPALLYHELDLTLRTVRDLFTPDIEKLIIDNRAEYERLLKFTQAFMPDFVSKIELYQEPEPIFDRYGIELEIERALGRKVFLKSGGYLIVDQREALTTIDVNTGRFVGKKNLEETITKTNLEACKEVADQIRLRNLGGILIIDFIDMTDQDNQEKVMHTFLERMRHDRAKTNVTRLSELGLIEMTRKRTRESLGRTLTEPCLYCEGQGYLKSKHTLCYEILRQIRRAGTLHPHPVLVVRAHPDVAELLATTEQTYLDELEQKLQKRLVIQPDNSFHLEKYEIRPTQQIPS